MAEQYDQMRRDDVRKGVAVVFRGPGDVVSPLFDAARHKLLGQIGTVVYGISEDVWCYPDNPELDLVWVTFECDRLQRRQVSAAWLEKLSE